MGVVLSFLCMRFPSSQGKLAIRDDPKSHQDSEKRELARFYKIAFRVPEVVTRLPQTAAVRRYFARTVYTRSQNHRLFCALSQRVHSARAHGRDYEYSPLGKKELRGYGFLVLDKKVRERRLECEALGGFAVTHDEPRLTALFCRFGDHSMAWFWIVLGLLAVVGSITWILPSPMERRQGERRMAALKLGMKVRIVSVDDWVKERLDVVQLSQYLIWTDKKPRYASLWRVPDRTEPWASPPEANSWDLLAGEFDELLRALPNDIVGVGADSGCVWVALDDAKADIEPDTIKPLLDQILAVLLRHG